MRHRSADAVRRPVEFIVMPAGRSERNVMSLPEWPTRPELGKDPCKTERDSWQCPNMQAVENDTSMTHEHYACKVCGRREALDYEEMR